MNAVLLISYILIWGLVAVSAYLLRLGLTEILQVHDEIERNRPVPKLPAFSLPLMGASGQVRREDFLGRQSVFIFPRLPTSLSMDPTTLQFILGLIPRLQARYAQSQVVVVSSGSKQENAIGQLASLGHFNLKILNDPQGSLGKALKITRTPAAVLFSKDGMRLKSGVVTGNESHV